MNKNCLLARYPLLFITGHQTPFYFSRYWNAIPKYLSEHGYEVIEVGRPFWMTDKKYLKKIKKFLASTNKSFHMIGDLSIIQLLIELSQDPMANKSLQSLNVATHSLDSSFIPYPIQNVPIGFHKESSSSQFKIFEEANDFCFKLHNFVSRGHQRSEASLLGLPYSKKTVEYIDYLKMAQGLAEKDFQTKGCSETRLT
ncbi:MAG: hypothetical protein KDD50_03955 [Bdellovibrionales bacterium]|nr:hypothetical protein [Bdellovibrionales bacterium]